LQNVKPGTTGAPGLARLLQLIFNGAGGANEGAVFFLANDEPYFRTGGPMIKKLLTIGNERPHHPA
jgi:hypothetical protein